MSKITPISKPPSGTRHTGPAAQLNPVPTRAGERRALAKTSAARSAPRGGEDGKKVLLWNNPE
ncbi:MAG: hypothetical protein ACK4SQ_16900 [Allorhizobium sp.]